MRWKRVLAALITAALLLSLAACGNVEDTTPPETVENIFTNPSESETVQTTEPNRESELLKFEGIVSIGNGWFRVLGDHEADENGPYFEYHGGDMCLTVSMCDDGTVGQYGIGLVIFLDGQPQAYKLTEDGEYSYMHTVYLEQGIEKIVDLYFVPCAGENGDILEAYIAWYVYPGYSDYNAIGTYDYGMNVSDVGPRIKLCADPPDMAYPQVKDRLLSCEVAYEETPWFEINDWTTEELRSRVDYHFFVEGSSLYKQYEYVPKDGKLTLRLEIWGNPDMEYGLVLFVEDQILSTEESELIMFGIQQGMTTVVEVTVDMSEYDGECAVVMALVPRNYRTQKVRHGSNQLVTTFAYKLYEEPHPLG